MTLYRSTILLIFYAMLIFFAAASVNKTLSKHKTSANRTDYSASLVFISEGQEFNNQGCDFGWTQQTSGITANLISVSTVSQLVGWAAGANGTVIRTVDGSTWTNANPNPGVINGDIYNIYAWSAADALCTTSPNATFIYKTTNGGVSWTQVHTNPNGFINGIIMVSPTEGYATGDPIGQIWEFLKTTNGGSTWIQMPTAPSSSDNETGWNNSFQILGNKIWWGSTSTKVYYSTNLGTSWLSGLTTGTANSLAVHYRDELTGMAGGSKIVLSTNGGANYTVASSPLVFGDVTGLEGIGSNWWALQSSSGIYRSTNDGSNWTLAFNATGTTLRHIDLKETDGCPMGWAVGDAGGIVRMGTTTSVAVNPDLIPGFYSLEQNYPNPFNPATTIRFSVPERSFVSVKVYDLNGKEIAVLINKIFEPGNHSVLFDAAGLSSGIYFYQIRADNFVSVRKMTVLK